MEDKMELNTGERLALLDALPNEGNFTTLKILRKLRESLSFSEQEHKDLNFVVEDNRVAWDETKDKPKDIVIGEKANDIIVESLKRLNANNKLTDSHFEIYEKFVGE